MSFTVKRDAVVSLVVRRACNQKVVSRLVRHVRAGTMWRSFSDVTGSRSLAAGRYTVTGVATNGTSRVTTRSVPTEIVR